MSYGQPPQNDPFAANPYQTPTVGGNYVPPPSPDNNAPMILGILSIISSSIGLLSVCCCLFIPFPLVGLTLGGIGLSLRPDPTARTMNFIGLGIGILAAVLWILGLVLGLAVNMADPNMRRL